MRRQPADPWRPPFPPLPRPFTRSSTAIRSDQPYMLRTREQPPWSCCVHAKRRTKITYTLRKVIAHEWGEKARPRPLYPRQTLHCLKGRRCQRVILSNRFTSTRTALQRSGGVALKCAGYPNVL
ncbi:hypothetical protein E2C01_075501 [Portunus trituberculatus]|uniref:Uncharacterized protein n=1 Tax=Portunus trituberculatus TaxID=210409 RepID=A0A5B7IKC0_PORTR|nr:hypothetical protein [Portunus trituberculatus]